MSESKLIINLTLTFFIFTIYTDAYLPYLFLC